MSIYCTYITFYRGNKLPPFYIGYTSIKNLSKGYKGSVSSKKYKEIWNKEVAENSHLFNVFLIKFFNTKNEALLHERYLHIHFDVMNNPMYINRSISDIKFTASKGVKRPDLSERNRSRINKKHTEEHRRKISETLRKRSVNKGRKRPDLSERNRQRKGTQNPNAFKGYLERKSIEGYTAEEIEAKRKGGRSNKGKKRSQEAKIAISEAAKERCSRSITCPICNKTSNHSPNFFRYHFKNCIF